MAAEVTVGSMTVASTTGTQQSLLADLGVKPDGTPVEEKKPEVRATGDVDAADGTPVAEDGAEPEQPTEKRTADGSWTDKTGREHNADGSFKAKAKAEAAAESEEPAEETEKPVAKADKSEKPKNSPEARIRVAVQRQRDAEDAYRAERQEVLRLREEIASLRVPRPQERQPERSPERRETVSRETGPAKPKADDFETYDEYLDARDAWNRQNWESEQQSRQKLSAVEQGIKRQVAAFKAEIAKRGPEFMDSLSEDALLLVPSYGLAEGERPTFRNVVGDIIFRKPDQAPAWLLHFTEHPEDLQKLSRLGPQEILWEMAQMSRDLGPATAGTAPRGQASNAKPPLRPVKGTPHTVSDDELDDSAPLSAFVQRFAAREQRASR